MLPVSMANSGGFSKRPLLLSSKNGIPSGSRTPAESGTPLEEDLLPIRGEVTLRSVHSVPVQHLAHHPWRDCTRLAIGGGQAHLTTTSGTGAKRIRWSAASSGSVHNWAALSTQSAPSASAAARSAGPARLPRGESFVPWPLLRVGQRRGNLRRQPRQIRRLTQHADPAAVQALLQLPRSEQQAKMFGDRWQTRPPYRQNYWHTFALSHCAKTSSSENFVKKPPLIRWGE